MSEQKDKTIEEAGVERQEGEEEQSKVDSEEIVEEIDKDFYYPEDHTENKIKDTPISKKMARFHEIFGINSFKLYNFSFLDDETIIYAAGITYQTYNYLTGVRKVYFSKDGGGIGSIAVNNKQTHFAVAEKGTQPNIYIYEYPSMRLYRILRSGTERSYSNISFSKDDTKLASVGSSPDYNICVWDWMNQILVLKSKAFSQEVFRVTFSEHSDKVLSTSGLAHIRFWKIASTFTGLKLKGETGKFGQIELSDVRGFYIFPDGKVLSGCENGTLLLWEGNLIKVLIAQGKEQTCHKGPINVVEKFKDKIVTSGADGYIKFWDFATIDSLEGDDNMLGFIQPVEQYQLYSNCDDDSSADNRTPCDILELKFYNFFWMVHDANGGVFKYYHEENRQERILEFNSGPITGICLAKNENACASIGYDGTIRLWDFVEKNEFYSRTFKGHGTCIDWLNIDLSKKNRYVAAGFSNGVMRVVFFKKDRVVLTKALKVHDCSISALKFSSDGEKLAVLSEKGEFFFFNVVREEGSIQVVPYCFSPTKQQINTMQWNRESTHLLLSCNNGDVIELEVPNFEDCETKETFLRENLNMKKFTIKMMMNQKPKKDMHSMAFMLNEEVEEVEVEWDPAPITSCLYLDEEEETFICSVEGNFAGRLYICSFDEERPIGYIHCTMDSINFMKMSHDRKYLIYGTESGDICVRPVDFLETFLRIKLHDQNNGKITGFSFNHSNELMVSSSNDGTVNVQVIDYSFLEKVKDLRIQMKEEANNKKVEVEESEKSQSKSQSRQLYDEDGEEEHLDEDGIEEEIEEAEEEEDSSAEEEEEVDLIVWPELEFPEKIGIGIDDHFFAEDPEEMEDAPDFTNDKGYSIQQEKLMAEKDRKRSLAEVKKTKIRDEIDALRKRFDNLQEKNDKVEEFFKLNFDEFNIDPEYHEILKARAQDMIDETTKELAFSIAKYEAITKKLKDFYINELEVDRFSVCGFHNSVIVTSFKVKKTSEYFEQRLKDTKGIIEAKDDEEAQDEEITEENNEEKAEKVIKGRKTAKDKQLEKMSYLEYKKKKLKDAHAESSKQQGQTQKFTREKMNVEKAKREAIRIELKEKKPKKENIHENIEIKIAEKTIGDYKLKCDPDYQVETSQRMSVLKQRKLILMVEHFNKNAKMKFNQDLISYRQRKKDLFEKISQTNKRISEINEELGISEELFKPEYNELIEFPEKIYEISQEDVEEEYTLRKEAEKRAKKGRFGGMDDEEDKKSENENEGGDQQKQEEFKELAYKVRKVKTVRETPLLLEENEIKVLRLQTEKNLLREEINLEIENFDKLLDELADEKIKLEYEFKLIAMKLITLYQELIILEAFEQRDNELYEKLRKQKAYENEIATKLADLVDRNAREKADLKNYNLALKEAETKYGEKIYPNDKEKASITYDIFKMKQKAKENKSNQDEDMDGADGDLDPDYEEEIAQKYSPNARKIALSIMSDQNAKLISERYKAEQQKDQSKEKLNRMKIEKAKLDEESSEIKNKKRLTQESIKSLQKLKMDKISELYVTFFLNLEQIQNLEIKDGEYKLPEKLDGEVKLGREEHRSILFSQKELEKLRKNKEKLIHDTDKIDEKEKKLKDEKIKLDKKLDILKEAEEEAIQERRENFQLKFGEEISLDILDGLEPTQKLKNLKKEFAKEEKESHKQIEAAKKSMNKTKKIHLSLKETNTQILRQITDLGNTQLNLNKNRP